MVQLFMKTVKMLLGVGTLLQNAFVAGIPEGSTCFTNDGAIGTCRSFRDCPTARKMIHNRIKPTLCSFKHYTPIVCCHNPHLGAPAKLQAPRKVRQKTLKRMATAHRRHNIFSDKCDAIPYNMTAPKTGRKAFDKCVEYQDQLVYPCVESPVLNGGMQRAKNCNWKLESLIIGGENAYMGEFPHMALLGFGTTIIEWLCGGTLISDRFVMTASHCTVSVSRGTVTMIKIGILERSEKVHYSNQYKVAEIHRHPYYHSPVVYHDIALLKTDRRINLNRYAVPACLHDGSPINDDEVIVTGWGTTKFRMRAESDVLQKVTLTKFSDEECADIVRGNRHMPYGYKSAIQICYGDKNSSRDSCNGDSGGPAQVRHPRIFCMYSIVGVISWGQRCGIPNEPGVYTRIDAYLDWIESIVWP